MNRPAGQSDSSPHPADRVLLDLRPAVRSVLLIGFGWLVIAGVLAVICWSIFASQVWPANGPLLVLLPILLILIVLVVAALIRTGYRFQLSESRVRCTRGILTRASTEGRLEHVQNITVLRTPLQRLLSLGTIHMTTAGIGPSVTWPHVARPAEVADEIRDAIDRAHGEPSPSIERPVEPIAPVVNPPQEQPAAQSESRTVPVIGLAGGIGAGKSTVARAFERLGCFVIDSDQRAKAALDRPDVRDALVEWWGADVLAADGRIDRSKVAKIVFADPEQRTRLEELVHPIVREDRAAMIREARADGRGGRAVIVDAPLLFEAGVDSECDFVVFVDTPREQRLQRVSQTRNWDEAELDRREASQMPIDEKRLRSHYVVENQGRPEEVDEQAAQVLDEILAQRGYEG